MGRPWRLSVGLLLLLAPVLAALELPELPSASFRTVEWSTLVVLVGMGVTIVALSNSIRRRRRAEASLRASHDLLNGIRGVQSLYIKGAEQAAVFDRMLSTLLAQTQSEYGFIGEVLREADGTPYLKTQAISNIAWDDATRAFHAAGEPEGMEFRNLRTLFGIVMTSAQPVISNNPSTDPRRHGTPAGHPPLNAFMGLPLFRGDQLVGVVGVANRKGGYRPEMVEQLQPFLSTCASLTHAIRDSRQRLRAEEAQRESEERFALFMQHFPGLAHIKDADTRVLFASQGFQTHLGMSPREMIGKTNAELFPADFAESMTADDRRVLQSGDHGEREERYGGRDWSTHKFVLRRPGLPPMLGGFTLDITERTRAREALQHSEELLRQAVRVSQIGVFDHDHLTDTVHWSPQQRAIFGWGPDEPVTLGAFLDTVHPDDRESIAAAVRRAHDPAGDGLYHVEHRIIRRDGEVRWLVTRSQTVFAGDGDARHPVRTVGADLDITAGRQAEDALRQSRKLLELILDTIPARVFWKDRDSRYLGCNRPFALDAGVGSPDEIIGQDDYQMGWRDQADLYRCDDRQVMESGSPKIDYEEPQTTPDGRRIWLRTSKTPLRDADGAIFGILGTYQDITEQKRAAQALEESEERLRLALTAANQGLYDLNVETGEALVSPEYATMLGYDPAEFRETNARWIERLHPDDRVRVAGTYRAYVRGESPSYNVEFRQRTKSGSWKWILSMGKIVARDAKGRPLRMLGTHTDITERKLAEQALVKEKERVQVTLHSIGDAVITTDAHGRVEYLNPVAERLTGWTADEAAGQPLANVFRIVNDETGEPAADPVARCLEEGRITGLANHTRLISRHGREYSVQDSAAPIRSSTGEVFGAVLVFSDVTETHRLVKQIAHEATHDTLTGLINRREFERRLSRALESAKEHGTSHALCYLDLDQFKIINDTAGHAAGDELLRQIKGLFAGRFRERDTFARLGGDEFGLLLNNCPLDKAREIAETLVATIYGYRFAWQGRAFQIGVSIGLAPITRNVESTDQLLSQADVACYTAKERGRNRVHVYRADDTESSLRHREILRAAGLRDALEQQRLLLYRQPIVPLAAGGDRPIRYEILIRMRDENGELVEPRAFIPAAERYGLMNAIDRWVIQTAFRHYAETQMASGAEMSINLSGNSLNDLTLPAFVQARFAEFALPPERVCFEITETAAIHQLSQAVEFMAAIKARGSRLALDDFGSGLSSFRYLKSLPVDYLKIDGSFVSRMTQDFVDRTLVAAINEVGHLLGIQTIAEHAHSAEAVEQLRVLGVDFAQGYALGQPAPLEG